MGQAAKKTERQFEVRAPSGRTVMAFGMSLETRAKDFAQERGLKLVVVTRTEREILL